MKKMIKITIPLAPITKKNSQRIMINGAGKPFIMPSAAYKDYEREAALFMPRGVHIKEPVNVKCVFYMPTRRKCDLTNLLEAIDDILVKSGVLADDNYTVIQSHDGSRVYYDKENPRTEIYINPAALFCTQAEEILFICDRQKCKKCSFPDCKHTRDINHAANFKTREEDFYIEREGEK